jgi:hypothetical protein
MQLLHYMTASCCTAVTQQVGPQCARHTARGARCVCVCCSYCICLLPGACLLVQLHVLGVSHLVTFCRWLMFIHSGLGVFVSI